jgi:hypothetical protein
LFLGACLEFVERLLLALLELLLDNVLTIAIFVALERGWNGEAQFADQVRHVVMKGASFSRRQPESTWPVRFREVVDVAPVRGRRPLCHALFHMAPHESILAGTGGTKGEQIISAVVHPDSEPNGLPGSILTNNIVERLQFSRGLERQFPYVASGVERLGRQWSCGHPEGLGHS